VAAKQVVRALRAELVITESLFASEQAEGFRLDDGRPVSALGADRTVALAGSSAQIDVCLRSGLRGSGNCRCMSSASCMLLGSAERRQAGLNATSTSDHLDLEVPCIAAVKRWLRGFDDLGAGATGLPHDSIDFLLRGDVVCERELSTAAFVQGTPLSAARLLRGHSASFRPSSRLKNATAPFSNSVPTMPLVRIAEPSR
jgi:hypothetical protein